MKILWFVLFYPSTLWVLGLDFMGTVRDNLSTLLSGSTDTCMQQTAPEGYFRNENCDNFHFYVCEISGNTPFSAPAEGIMKISHL